MKLKPTETKANHIDTVHCGWNENEETLQRRFNAVTKITWAQCFLSLRWNWIGIPHVGEFPGSQGGERGEMQQVRVRNQTPHPCPSLFPDPLYLSSHPQSTNCEGNWSNWPRAVYVWTTTTSPSSCELVNLTPDLITRREVLVLSYFVVWRKVTWSQTAAWWRRGRNGSWMLTCLSMTNHSLSRMLKTEPHGSWSCWKPRLMGHVVVVVLIVVGWNNSIFRFF